MFPSRDRESDTISLNFYIQYSHLSSRDLGGLLIACSDLSNAAYDHYTESSANAWFERPTLELSEIQTGQSIKFKFVESAVPSISSDADDDIVIGVPKKLGIPVLMAMLLLAAANNLMDMKSKYLEIQLKQLDLQLKQEEINKIRHGRETSVPEELEKQSRRIVLSMISNRAFTSISINGVEIKGVTGGESNDEQGLG